MNMGCLSPCSLADSFSRRTAARSQRLLLLLLLLLLAAAAAAARAAAAAAAATPRPLSPAVCTVAVFPVPGTPLMYLPKCYIKTLSDGRDVQAAVQAALRCCLLQKLRAQDGV